MGRRPPRHRFALLHARRLAGATGMLCAALAAAAGTQPAADIASAARSEALRLGAAAASRVEVKEVRVDPRLRLPRCERPLAARPSAGTRTGGRLTVEVLCGAPAWRVFVPVTLSARGPVAVAARPLVARHTLAAGDVVLTERDLHAAGGAYFQRVEDVLGLEVTRALGAGEVLSTSSVRAGSLVRRGQSVTLLAQNDSVSVQMKGEVLANGGLNQRVRVRNLSSGREVEGVVRSADLVEVPFL